MKLIGKLLVLGVLAAGVAGCEDTYSNGGYGRGYYSDRYGYDREYDRYVQGGNDRSVRGYYGDRDYDRSDSRYYDDRDSRDQPQWVWRGANRYCLTPDNRYEYCGSR